MLLSFTAVFLLILLVYPHDSVSQTVGDDGGDGFNLPGDMDPGDGPVGPVGNVDAEYKFDPGFYQKIQGLMLEEPRDGDLGVYDGKRYYNVILVVSRDDGDGRDSGATAEENKAAVAKRLDLLGARDITAAGSLSFVTASIPVAYVPGFSLHEEVYRMGDGELPVTFEVDMARQTIHATMNEINATVGRILNGTGVVVAVVDDGINHATALNPKVSNRVVCGIAQCIASSAADVSPTFGWDTSHGTRVAQVLAASGLDAHNGIAPGVELLDAHSWDYGISQNSASAVAHALDWSLRNGADVVNMSIGIGRCSNTGALTATSSLIVNEAVDKGMIAVKSAGNRGNIGYTAVYESITNPGCAHNVIAVGGINDRAADTITMYTASSRGPTAGDGTIRMKPDLVAPAVNIQVLNSTTTSITAPDSGTSYAAPQVSATAAMLLQAKPDLTPVEVKAALLLGAAWQGPIPCTSTQYEMNNSTDNCSYAMQDRTFATANDAASLGRLNNVGFGILDTAQTLEYVYQRNATYNHVLRDHLDTNNDSKQYTFNVTDTTEPVKVILTWFVHPHGGITDQSDRTGINIPVADLDFTVSSPAGTIVQRAESADQTNEFAVFYPGQTGIHTITVSGSDLGSLNKPVQNFALASTLSISLLSSISATNTLPVAYTDTVIVNSNSAEPTTILLHGYDQDGDALSFSISGGPHHGTMTTPEFITNNVSRILYTTDSTFTSTDSFYITPQDGLDTGTPVLVTINAESLPPGSIDTFPTSDSIMDWDTHEVTNSTGFAQTRYLESFDTIHDNVSAVYVGATHMQGVDATFTTPDGSYTMWIPANGTRMIGFSPSITIQNMTLSADGLDEEAAYNNTNSNNTKLDIRMFAGYSCATPCPEYRTYSVTTSPDSKISDNETTSSTLFMPVNGTLRSVSIPVHVTHTYVGDLSLVLTSPDGTDITLHNRTNGVHDSIITTYDSSSHPGLDTLNGSGIRGDWTLSATDHAKSDTGTLHGWGVSLTYVHANITATSTVEGRVFNDTNEDGQFNGSDQGLGGVNVTVVDYLELRQTTVTTDSKGRYSAGGIIPYSTLVQAWPIPAGFLPSGDLRTYYITTLTDDATNTINFALHPVEESKKGTITIHVFHDVNDNGVKDLGEVGVEGARVFTYELLTAVSNVQTTGPGGTTIHTGLIPDVVLAQINTAVLPAGFTNITTINKGYEYVDVTPNSTTTVEVGLR